MIAVPRRRSWIGRRRLRTSALDGGQGTGMWLAAARGALGVGLPLLCGAVTGDEAIASMAAIGGLWGVSQDGADRPIRRVPRVAVTAAASALGLAAGLIVLRSCGGGWPVWAALAVVAMVAGALEAGSPLAAAAGMQLLVGAVIGTGYPFPGPWWLPPAALLSGAVFVLVLAVAGAPGGRTAERRRMIAACFEALAETSRALGSGEEGARRRVLAAHVNEAQDLIAPLARRRRWSLLFLGTNEADSAVLVSAFEVAVRLGEISSAMMAQGQPVPAIASEIADGIGRRLLRPGWHAALPAAWHRDGQALSDAAHGDPLVRQMAGVLEAASRGTLEPLGVAPHRPAVPLGERVRFAFLLAAAIVVASVAGYAMHGARGYWLPLALAFIFRPDLGPVTRRAAGRAAGTAAGAIASILLGLAAHATFVLPAVAACCAAVMPAASRRGYGLSVTAFTPIVFVFLASTGAGGLVMTRIVDTALAAVIALLADLAAWSRAPSRRSDAAIRRVEAAVAVYVARGARATPAQRHALRRRAFTEVAGAHAAVCRDTTELQRSRRPATGAPQRIAAAEAEIDKFTHRLLLPPQTPAAS